MQHFTLQPFRILLTFVSASAELPLITSHISGNRLQGVLFALLSLYNQPLADLLHGDPQQAPHYAVAPRIDARHVVGMEICVFSAEIAIRLFAACEQCYHDRCRLRMGNVPLLLSGVTVTTGPTFQQLQAVAPAREMTIQFHTPTAFGQRNKKAHLLFPLPEKLFSPGSGPVRLWNQYAPDGAILTSDWLMWAAQSLYICRHDIYTVVARQTVQIPFVGFQGKATLRAAKRDDSKQRMWHALAQLATYSGLGLKTTRGMGHVTLIDVK